MKRLSIVLVLALCISACDEDKEGGNICGIIPFEFGDTAGVLLKGVNGMDLPAQVLYVDSENYLEVEAGFLNVSNDGTWFSNISLYRYQNGDREFDVIQEEGTYTCDGESLVFLNSRNEAAGTMTKSGDDLILSSGSLTYTFQ